MAAPSLSLHGVDIAVPAGWEAEIGWAGETAPSGYSSPPRILAHLANFILPTVRGDYGSGAVEHLDANAIFVALLEFAPTSPGGVFSASGLPRRLRGGDFSPQALQRRLPGQAGLQRFLTVGERRFVLYVVIGSYRLRDLLAPEASRALRSITIG